MMKEIEEDTSKWKDVRSLIKEYAYKNPNYLKQYIESRQKLLKSQVQSSQK
jgi:ribosomal protein S18